MVPHHDVLETHPVKTKTSCTHTFVLIVIINCSYQDIMTYTTTAISFKRSAARALPLVRRIGAWDLEKLVGTDQKSPTRAASRSRRPCSSVLGFGGRDWLPHDRPLFRQTLPFDYHDPAARTAATSASPAQQPRAYDDESAEVGVPAWVHRPSSPTSSPRTPAGLVHP